MAKRNGQIWGRKGAMLELLSVIQSNLENERPTEMDCIDPISSHGVLDIQNGGTEKQQVTCLLKSEHPNVNIYV